MLDVWQGEGGEQGDALMPVLFCMAMKGALDEIQAELRPGEVVLAYLDDLYFVTPQIEPELLTTSRPGSSKTGAGLRSTKGCL
jgi:hypothetical protein